MCRKGKADSSHLVKERSKLVTGVLNGEEHHVKVAATL